MKTGLILVIGIALGFLVQNWRAGNERAKFGEEIATQCNLHWKGQILKFMTVVDEHCQCR